MGKLEWKHVRSLTKIRRKESWLFWKRAVLLFGAVLLLVTVGSFGSRSHWNLVRVSEPPVFLACMLWASIVYVLVETVEYRNRNRVIGMFPQSNRERFWSYVLLIHEVAAACIGIGLLLYFVGYLLFGVIGKALFDWQMVYPFHLGLTFASALVALLIVSVVCAFCAWLEAIYIAMGNRFYLLIVATAVMCCVGNGFLLNEVRQHVLPFWTEESSLVLFGVKMCVTWLLLLGMAGWLTRRTRYYHQKPVMKSWVIGLCLLLIAGAASYIVVMWVPKSMGESGGELVSVTESEYVEKYYQETGGRDWEVLTVTLTEPAEKLWYELGEFSLSVKESPEVRPGTLQITYLPPVRYVNRVPLNRFYEYEVTVTPLEKGELVLAYHSEEEEESVTGYPPLSLCFYSPCGGWMNAFDLFQDQGLYKDFIGSQGGTACGYAIVC